jgi:hypothetical protein
MAPGGNLGQDNNKDSYPDGILAESFQRGAPTKLGYWLFAGTSQAAAQVSAVAAQLLQSGAHPDDVRALLQAGASRDNANPFINGQGAGSISLAGAIRALEENNTVVQKDYYIAIVPYLLEQGAGEIYPAASLMVLDENGNKASGVKVAASIQGSTQELVSCTVYNGRCTLKGSRVEPNPEGDIWAISVDAVYSGTVSYPPHSFFALSSELDAMLKAMAEDENASAAVLAFHWREGDNADLGWKLAESYVFTDLSTQWAGGPQAVILSPSLWSQATLLEQGSVETDGTGLSTSPLSIRLVPGDLDGTGLSTSPLSYQLVKLSTDSGSVSLLGLDGTGLSTSPLSFSALTTIGGMGLSTSPLSFQPVAMNSTFGSSYDDASMMLGTSLVGTAADEQLALGGWTSSSGQSASASLLASFDGTMAGYSDITVDPMEILE